MAPRAPFAVLKPSNTSAAWLLAKSLPAKAISMTSPPSSTRTPLFTGRRLKKSKNRELGGDNVATSGVVGCGKLFILNQCPLSWTTSSTLSTSACWLSMSISNAIMLGMVWLLVRNVKPSVPSFPKSATFMLPSSMPFNQSFGLKPRLPIALAKRSAPSPFKKAMASCKLVAAVRISASCACRAALRPVTLTASRCDQLWNNLTLSSPSIMSNARPCCAHLESSIALLASSASFCT
mmetsp:Transcript_65377/g.121889  ORF Transcript_65377/g.121889 Transcript_65377/m.121889 type:complete len:236 (-) Transcript_65377:389-1096(-)